MTFFCLFLTACGGGGSSDVSPPLSAVSVVVSASQTVSKGDALTFSGQGSSSAGAITGMAWRIDVITLDANAVTAVKNADCKSAVKNTSGTSWTCELQLTPPSLLTADYTYRLTLTAVDVKGNTSSASTNLVVLKEASSIYAPVAKVAAPIVATSGDKVSLTCSGSGGTPAESGDAYSFQWVVNDAAGLKISLLTDIGATTSFTAPVVTASTTVKIQCRVTDDKQKTGTALQSVVINPLVKPTVIPISTSGGVVQAGSSATLDGSKSVVVDASGKVVNSTIYYYWSQKSGPALDISNVFSSIANISFPKIVSARTAYVFTLSVSNSPIDSAGTSADPIKQVDVAYYVDPLPPISLVSYSPTQIIPSNSNAVLKADAPSNFGSVIYYSWTQISGPPVILAGANSANAGFITPVVSADTMLVFRVSAGYVPVTVATPGTAALDVVVMVTPPPKT